LTILSSALQPVRLALPLDVPGAYPPGLCRKPAQRPL